MNAEMLFINDDRLFLRIYDDDVELRLPSEARLKLEINVVKHKKITKIPFQPKKIDRIYFFVRVALLHADAKSPPVAERIKLC